MTFTTSGANHPAIFLLKIILFFVIRGNTGYLYNISFDIRGVTGYILT